MTRVSGVQRSDTGNVKIVAIFMLIFMLVAVEAGVVMRARAALHDPFATTRLIESMVPPPPQFDWRPAPRLEFDQDTLVARALSSPELAFDFRPPPRLDRPDPERLIAAMLGPADLAFDFRPPPRLERPDPDRLIAAALGPAEIGFDLRFAPRFDGLNPDGLIAEMVAPPTYAFDLRPGPRVERHDPDRLIAAMLPAAMPFDWRPAPRLGPTDPVVLMVSLMPNIREVLQIGPMPELPRPQPPRGEPHMQPEESWVGRWRKRNPEPREKIHFASHVVSRCLPDKLIGVLADVAEKFGTVKVISGYRSPSHNRRVGGATRSMHLECRAIDFYVHGRNAGLLDYLARRKEVGGYARYPFGSYHIDNGPRRSW